MRTNKDGSPDKRFKKKNLIAIAPKDIAKNETTEIVLGEKQDPNELHTQLLKDNNLKLDFDVLEGTVPTRFGIIKLEKPTLVIKASYLK